MPSVTCIFVVDDDESARNGLARLLRPAGHEVRTFASSNEFLDAFEPEVTGCLLLDARMPGLSGPELKAELEARDIHLPTIVVTADNSQEAKQIAQNMKATGFFRKPVDSQALLDAIEWALHPGSADDNHEKI